MSYFFLTPRLALAAFVLTTAMVNVASADTIYKPCTVVPQSTDGSNPFSKYFAPYTFNGVTAQRAANLCYGTYLQWSEQAFGKTSDVTLDRRFEMFRPGSLPLRQKLPLVIFAHPNGGTERMEGKGVSGNYPDLTGKVMPAITNGFAFMSIEFRHPRGSTPYKAPAPPPPPEPGRDEYSIPNTDIATAVQWARSRADDLGIDVDNIFLLGQSRGSLSVLTALMPDQIATGTGFQDYQYFSSKPRAVFAVQAQTTYRHSQLRDLFLTPYASASANASISTLPLEFPSCLSGQPTFNYYCYFDKEDPIFHISGSALNELDNTDPPVWLRYERSPTDPMKQVITPIGMGVGVAGGDQSKGLCYEPDVPGCFDVHHPNFGLALRLRYLQLPVTAGRSAYVFAQFADGSNVDYASSHFYDDYQCFFIQNLTPAGKVLRKAASNTPDCALHESDVWPPAAP
ncbi:MAG TPA: hypothetical protein VFM48_01360 [Aquabacterium sp.]|nr:hypothetical protein [Aquabacterium sp.]